MMCDAHTRLTLTAAIIDLETDQSASESDDEAPPASQSTKVTSRGG